MDLIDVVQKDHETVEALLERVATVTGKRREGAFARLRGELVRHEVAEEEIVHPLTRSFVGNGDRIAKARVHEEEKAEGILKKMERLEIGTPPWERLFGRLRTAVLEHAEKEETIEHPRLRERVEKKDLARHGRAFQSMKKLAPTRPHPGTPNSAVANMAAGPVAALVDRARDAASEAVAR
ncbi:MAG TPA: hemerythrin domain-containing protein [Acidimicrobiales bacterium]|nr:hemerythrin domain-containing protein [Acidimicrobiales bacterium]